MYSAYLLSEFRKWIRDPMMKFLIIYPVFFALIGRYVLPLVAESSGFVLDFFADFILVFLSLMIPQIFGALLGFSIIDDREDHILSSIKVTPLSIHQFLSFKLIIITLFSFLASIFVLWFSDIGGLTIQVILSISFLSAFSCPVTGLLINAFAKNKIEGFAIMKGLGTTLLFPVLSLFFFDKRELFFSFVPGFWPAKAISSFIRGDRVMLLSFNQYYLIGLLYVLVLNVLIYRFFLGKIRSD